MCPFLLEILHFAALAQWASECVLPSSKSRGRVAAAAGIRFPLCLPSQAKAKALSWQIKIFQQAGHQERSECARMTNDEGPVRAKLKSASVLEKNIRASVQSHLMQETAE